MMHAPRYFVRCTHCLAVLAIEEQPPAALACSCGGSFETMGRVSQAGYRLERDETRSACDDRCTNATGPNCDCQCHGENHGTRRVVTIHHDAGPVPQLRSPKPERGAEYRQALQDAQARIGAKFPPGGRWLPESAYWEKRAALSTLAHARTLKTHAGRLRALAEVLPLSVSR